MPIPAKQLATSNARFSGSATLPAVTALLPQTITFVVTPVIAGDVLGKGEVITVTPAAALPGGLNVAYAIATASNTVQIGLSATLGIVAAAAPIAWAVAAHR